MGMVAAPSAVIGRRLAARAIDFIVIAAMMEIGLLAHNFAENLFPLNVAFGLGLQVLAIVALFLRDCAVRPGQSLGKRLLGCRTVCLNDQPFTPGTSAKRNAIFAVAALVEMLAVNGIVWALFAIPAVFVIDLVLLLSFGRSISDVIGGTIFVRA